MDQNIIAQRIMLLESIKTQAKKYKDAVPEKRQEIWHKVVDSYQGLPLDIIHRIKELADLDIEAANHVRPDFNPDKMTIWQRMKKDPSWPGYWKNATGFDVEMYINIIIAAVRYPDDRKNRPLDKWFCDNNPTIKPIPYSVSVSNEDFNNFFIK